MAYQRSSSELGQMMRRSSCEIGKVMTRSTTELRKLQRRASCDLRRTTSGSLVGKGLKQQMLDALIFSLAAYEPTPEKVLAVLRCKYDLPVGILDVFPLDGVSPDRFGSGHIIVGRNSAHGHVVVACRGTADLADVVADLKFIHKRLPFAEGAAHLGFVQRAANVNIEPFLKLLEDGEQIVFTGHSLGGAVASLVALRVLEEASRNGSWCPHQHRVQVITFGAPLFANAGLAEMINTKYRDIYHHIVSKNDLVPKILPLLAAGHRLIGGEPQHMAILRIARMGLDIVEHVTKLPVASAVRKVENIFPGPVRSLMSIAMRLFWPGESEHQYAFAGTIVMLDRTELAVDKAVRLTKAEELNYWCSQLGFGLGLNFGAVAEHGLSNYYEAISKGMKSRLLEYMAGGRVNSDTVSSAATAVGMRMGGVIAREMMAEEGCEGDDCKVTVRCNVDVKEQMTPVPCSKSKIRRCPLPKRSPGGDYGAIEDNSSSEDTDYLANYSKSQLSPEVDRRITPKKKTISGKCMQCVRALQVYSTCEVTLEREGQPTRKRQFRFGWLIGTLSQVSRHLRSLDKVCLAFSAIRFVVSNPFF